MNGKLSRRFEGRKAVASGGADGMGAAIPRGQVQHKRNLNSDSLGALTAPPFLGEDR